MSQTQQEQSEAKLLAYIEGELDPASLAEIEKHLEAHPQHRKLLQDLRGMRDWVRWLPRETPPPEIGDAFSSQFERAVLLGPGGRVSFIRRINRWPQIRAAAAVAALAVGLGVVVYKTLPPRVKPVAIAPSSVDGAHGARSAASSQADQRLQAAAGTNRDKPVGPGSMPDRSPLALGTASPPTAPAAPSAIFAATPPDEMQMRKQQNGQPASGAAPVARLDRLASQTYAQLDARELQRDAAAPLPTASVDAAQLADERGSRPIVLAILSPNPSATQAQVDAYLSERHISSVRVANQLEEQQAAAARVGGFAGREQNLAAADRSAGAAPGAGPVAGGLAGAPAAAQPIQGEEKAAMPATSPAWSTADQSAQARTLVTDEGADLMVSRMTIRQADELRERLSRPGAAQWAAIYSQPPAVEHGTAKGVSRAFAATEAGKHLASGNVRRAGASRGSAAAAGPATQPAALDRARELAAPLMEMAGGRGGEAAAAPLSARRTEAETTSPDERPVEVIIVVRPEKP